MGKLGGFFFESEAEEIVFGDDEGRVGFLGFGTEKTLLFNGQASVLSQNNGFGLGEGLCYLGELMNVSLVWHLVLFID